MTLVIRAQARTARSRRKLQSRCPEPDLSKTEQLEKSLQHWAFTDRLRDLLLITLSLNAGSLSRKVLGQSWKCFREGFYAPIPTSSLASCTLLIFFKYLSFFS